MKKLKICVSKMNVEERRKTKVVKSAKVMVEDRKEMEISAGISGIWKSV